MSTARTAPTLDPAACVRSQARGVSCAACALACPAGALTPTAEGVSLEAEACTGCRICQGVCPQGALGAAPRPEGEAADVLVCARHPAAARGTAISCVHALGLADLAALVMRGGPVLRVATGDCAACPDGVTPRLAELVQDLSLLAAARGLTPVRLEEATDGDLQRWHREAAPEAGRRRLLRGFAAEPEGGDRRALDRLLSRPPREGATAPMPVSPRIDETSCTGCDACVQICPEGALSLIRDSDDQLWYHVKARLCTGCGLCTDLCDAGAIALEPLAPATPPVALRSFTCAVCGVPSHSPAEAPATETCRICRQRPHARALYQVLD